MAAAALAACLPCAPAVAQSAGSDASGLAAGLEVFGLTLGTLFAGLAALIVLHVVALFVATRAAGLPGSLGRPVLVLMVTAFLLVPLAAVEATVQLAASPTAVAVLSSAGYFGAETCAIKWIYGAPWPRALLAFFIAATLFNVGTAVLMLSFL